MTVLDRLALQGIHLYRRHVSPHKGFRCAHAALHGGESCSAAVTRIVRSEGLMDGRRSIAARFLACRSAYDSLHGGSPLALGSQGGPRVRGVCCCGPLPIPFRCG